MFHVCCSEIYSSNYFSLFGDRVFPRASKGDRSVTLQWRHNGSDGASNHQPHPCLLNRLFRRRSKKTSKLDVTGLCAGNSLGTGEFPAQMASNAENVSIWWRNHAMAIDALALNVRQAHPRLPCWWMSQYVFSVYKNNTRCEYIFPLLSNILTCKKCCESCCISICQRV